MQKEAYSIYVEKYGKVKSGAKLDREDYGGRTAKGFVRYDEAGQLAVSLAAQDAKEGGLLRSRTDFDEQIKRLSGS